MAQRSMNRGMVAGIVAVVLVGGGFVFTKFRKPRQARHDVQELRAGLEFYLREQGSYPIGTAAEMCSLLLGHTVRDQNPRRLSYIEASPREINGAGEFIDPWGQPYRILTGNPPTVYSCGPNQIDEQGGGDDISAAQ